MVVAQGRHVEELLLRVWREREASNRVRIGGAVDECLRLVGAIDQEDLNAVEVPISHIHQPIVGDFDSVHRAELWRSEDVIGRWLFVGCLERLVLERAPHPFVFPGVGIEHDHSAVTVAVRQEDLVRSSIHGRLRGSF